MNSMSQLGKAFSLSPQNLHGRPIRKPSELAIVKKKRLFCESSSLEHPAPKSKQQSYFTSLPAHVDPECCLVDGDESSILQDNLGSFSSVDSYVSSGIMCSMSPSPSPFELPSADSPTVHDPMSLAARRGWPQPLDLSVASVSPMNVNSSEGTPDLNPLRLNDSTEVADHSRVLDGWFVKCRGCSQLTGGAYLIRSQAVPFCSACLQRLFMLPKPERRPCREHLFLIHQSWARCGN